MTRKKREPLDLFDLHFLKSLEDFFKDVFVELIPWDQIPDDCLLIYGDAYTSFNRHETLFQDFYLDLKDKLLDLSLGHNSDVVEDIIIRTMKVHNLGVMLAYIPDFSQAEKEDVKDFSAKENTYIAVKKAYENYREASHTKKNTSTMEIDTFDKVLIPVLEDVFKDGYVLITPFEKIKEDVSLCDEDFHPFDRNQPLFQQFFGVFKDGILPKIHGDDWLKAVGVLCRDVISLPKFQNKLCSISDWRTATKGSVAVFTLSNDMLQDIADGLSSYLIHDIKQTSEVATKNKKRKVMK